MQGEMTEARAYQESGSWQRAAKGGGGDQIDPQRGRGAAVRFLRTGRRRSPAAASRGLQRVAGWIAPNLEGTSTTGPGREEGAEMDNPEGAQVSVRWVMNGANRADTMAGMVAWY
jgi:hypothetical protein